MLKNKEAQQNLISAFSYPDNPEYMKVHFSEDHSKEDAKFIIKNFREIALVCKILSLWTIIP